MSKPGSAKSKFVDYVVHDLMEGIKGVRSRAMFGGHGIYKDELFFALVADDELYFKVDDTNKKDYAAAKSEPFTYQAGRKKVTMSYWKVPAHVLEDRELLEEWASKAWSIQTKKK